MVRLPETVAVMPGIDAEALATQFRRFEALHMLVEIMNPLSSDDLDAVVEALDPGPGERVLDLACGHGELLRRVSLRTPIDGVGVDMSPWQIARAASRGIAGVEWRLGDAAEVSADATFDLAACLGASWVWDGFAGTAAALAAHTRSGGRIAIGDLQRRPTTRPEQLDEDWGTVLDAGEQRAVLDALGLDVITEVAPGDEAWDVYDAGLAASVEEWARLHPGEEADTFLADQVQWAAEHHDQRRLLAWTVWVARA